MQLKILQSQARREQARVEVCGTMLERHCGNLRSGRLIAQAPRLQDLAAPATSTSLRDLLCCAGDGGFFIISANQTQFQADFFVLGSLFSQCTVTMFADTTLAPTYSPNCALGQPNSCCNADGGNECYRKKK